MAPLTFPFRSLTARAAAHRAMARAALFSDSSLKTRYQRYSHHMDKARALEARLATRLLVPAQEART